MRRSWMVANPRERSIPVTDAPAGHDEPGAGLSVHHGRAGRRSQPRGRIWPTKASNRTGEVKNAKGLVSGGYSGYMVTTLMP